MIIATMIGTTMAAVSMLLDSKLLLLSKQSYLAF